MKVKFSLKSLLILFVSVACVSCGGYSKLLKGTDNSKKFNKAIEYFKAEKYSKSISLLQDVTPYYSGTSKEDTIAYYLGASMYKQGDFYSSGEIFDEFRRRYGRSPFIEDVEYMYAKGFYFASPEANRDQTATIKAIATIDEYLNRYPNSAKKDVLLTNIEELKQKLHDKSYINARVYYDIGYLKSAVMALKNAIDEFPESSHREELSYLIVSSNYMYARNSLDNVQRVRYMNMQESYFNFISEFPDSKYRKAVDKMQEESKRFLAKYAEQETISSGSKEPVATTKSDATKSAQEERKGRKQLKVEMKDMKIQSKSESEALTAPTKKESQTTDVKKIN